MKELSIEQKAKAYDKALERVKDFIEKQNPPAFDKDLIGTIFPELRENEDEKIRKGIIKYLSWIKDRDGSYMPNNIPFDEMIAWLEKQADKDKLIKELGEYKVKYTQEVLEKHINSMSDKDDERLRKTTIAFLKDFVEQGYENAVECIDWLEKQGEQKPADKVEPKFHQGEWITNGDYTWKIKEVKPLDYILQSQDGNIVDDTTSHVDEQFHSFTIEDAKNGDVLAAHECIVLFKEIDGLNIKCHCTYHFMNNPSFYINTLQNKSAFHPATKEQRDALEKAMADAGYEFDFDKKELKKIEQKPEQKPAWSEEDDYNLQCCIAKVQFDIDNGRIGRNRQLLTWLKSLRPQNAWKPSDEQMIALRQVISGCSYDIEPLLELETKLKEF